MKLPRPTVGVRLFYIMKKKILIFVFCAFALVLTRDSTFAFTQYQIIDSHEHYRAGADINVYLSAARRLSIEKTVFFPTGSAPNNSGFEAHANALLRLARQYPDKIAAFCSANDKDPGAARKFEQCLRRGGRGLKLLSGHPNFYTAPLNNEIVKSLFSAAQTRGVPVVLHVNIVRLSSAKRELEDLLSEFSGVKVLAPHFCGALYNGFNLDQCADLLDRYPNLYTDTTMGSGFAGYVNMVSRYAGEIRSFISRYQDRVLFGADLIFSSSGQTANPSWAHRRIKCELSLLKQQRFICSPLGAGAYTGLDLADSVLRKIFNETPAEFYGFR